jgi:tRNA threonylcarbamoyladenosine biosynthesis protein TsaB
MSEGGPRVPQPIYGAVLAVDTATDAPGVALRHRERTRVRAIGWRAAFREMSPAVTALLAEANLGLDDLHALVVPAGPGSFTGLRIGATLAVALSRARGIPLHAVPTLEAVAEAYAPAGASRVCSVVDARRGRWYAALYERDPAGWRMIEGPADLAPDAIDGFAGGAAIVGSVVPSAPDSVVTSVADLTAAAPVAAALAGIVAFHPTHHRLDSPADLRILYARSGVDR